MEIQEFRNLQINYSVGPPEISRIAVNEFNIVNPAIKEYDDRLPNSRTFRRWDFLPWDIISVNNITLATLAELTVTFTKAIDPDTGGTVIFAKILFRQFSRGYHSAFPSQAVNLRILILNTSQGLLEDWTVVDKHIVNCGDNGIFISFAKTFRPDFFELIDKVAFLFGPSLWYKC